MEKSKSASQDPVCGMTVDETTALHAERDGQTFYFCSEHCREKFLAQVVPDKTGGDCCGAKGEHVHQGHYKHAHGAEEHSCCGGKTHADAHHHDHGDADVNQSSAAKYFCPMCEGVVSDKPGACSKCGMSLERNPAYAETKTTIYTCPMHPQIRENKPGNCPICGMTLEPVTPSEAPEEDNAELKDMTRRFWIGLALTIPVLILSMGEFVPGVRDILASLGTTTVVWTQFVLSTPVVLWAGWPFFERGGRSLVTRHLNMFTLISIGTGAAYFYSVVATVFPSLFPNSFRMNGTVAVYFEASAMITVLVLLGQVLELKARAATGSAIKALLGLAPKTARLVKDDNSELDVPLEQVKVGDRLRVRPGEKVPVDGIVLEGQGAIDESMITGEPMPVAKEPKSPVTGSTINGTGSFVMKAEKVGNDTLLARIVQMVGSAQRSRAPIQRVADTVSGYFVPVVLLSSALTFVVWAWVGPEPRYAYALVNAVAVLIIACPCALGLATPMSIMVGVGRGAQLGILIRDAEALERLEKITTLAIDKTGTLTEGKPTLTEVIPAPGITEGDLLWLAASVEAASEHPLAAAIVAGAKKRNVALKPVDGFESVTGQGVRGKVEGHVVTVGKADLTKAAVPEALAAKATELRKEGQTVFFVGKDGSIAGLLAVTDPIKQTTPAAIDALHHLGIKVVMLTGDNADTAKKVADKLHIDQIEAEVTPDKKNDAIVKLKKAGERVAMAGDGVNDAPALAAADVGIAMGTGTDVAMESAGVTLVKGDLGALVRSIELSRATMNNIRLNLIFAFVYNGLGIPIAAGVLYPVFGLLLNPMLASAAMALSSVSVIANSLRLRGAIR
jgi:Cu+-exporting ATPase